MIANGHAVDDYSKRAAEVTHVIIPVVLLDDEMVARQPERRGIIERELVALCQTVPGPASSQVGYLIGLRRAGWAGAFAAWAGFTLPSALVMFAFALLAPHLEGPTTNAVLHGLKLVAVAVVAQAVWSMARNLCPDRPRAALALLAAALLLVISGSFVQIAVLLIGAVGGALLCRNLPAAPELPAMPVTLRTGGMALGLFLILLVTLPLAGAVAPHSLLALAGIFYKAGALVFGGGHVVLPLLRDALPARLRPLKQSHRRSDEFLESIKKGVKKLVPTQISRNQDAMPPFSCNQN